MARIALVLLAAGTSQRFAGPKLDIDWGGQPLLRRQLQAALGSKAAFVAVVLGAYAQRYQACALPDPRLTILYNPEWQDGLGRSIACGVQEADERAADGVLLALADQIALQPSVLDALADRLAVDPGTPVACRYDGRLGPPAAFGRKWFPALRLLRGDQGAQRLLREAPHVDVLEWPEGAFDVDTPEDWLRWRPNPR
ncbi:MAG TPA: nucleotidyltransferase family protein [Chthoniobacterales bacterium]